MNDASATTDCLILGAGLAGLSCAYHLQRPATVLEADAQVGGTARTTVRDGFGFDVTGHWLHLRRPDVRALVDALCPGLFASYRRRAEVSLRGVRTPYPFQAHTFGHDAQVVAECLLGFVAAQAGRATAPEPQNFAEYVRQVMGEGIARHFMLPYNRKLWCVPPEELAHTWCGRFVPLPTAEEVVWGALRPEGAGRALGYNSAFAYPRTGGIGQLPEALARAQRHPLHVRCRVEGIDAAARVVRCADGRCFGYRHLVSTLPLPKLIDALARDGAVPDDVLAAAARLRATELTYWDVGLTRSAEAAGVARAQWTYFPEPQVPFFRVGSPSEVRADLAPDGGRSYYVEVAHPQGTACPVGDAVVLQGLRAVGLGGPDETPRGWARNHRACAYVVMDHAYGPARATVLRFLRGQGIVSTGRFGAWIYDSMEGALVQGREVASALDGLGDAPPRPRAAKAPTRHGIGGIAGMR